jgi:hypothetical protein
VFSHRRPAVPRIEDGITREELAGMSERYHRVSGLDKETSAARDERPAREDWVGVASAPISPPVR